MTRRVLSRTCVVSKDQVSHERADSNRKHYPSIISHEEQHQHEGIERLHRINHRLDNMCLLANLHLIASCPQERRPFSNSFNFTPAGEITISASCIHFIFHSSIDRHERKGLFMKYVWVWGAM